MHENTRRKLMFLPNLIRVFRRRTEPCRHCVFYFGGLRDVSACSILFTKTSSLYYKKVLLGHIERLAITYGAKIVCKNCVFRNLKFYKANYA